MGEGNAQWRKKRFYVLIVVIVIIIEYIDKNLDVIDYIELAFKSGNLHCDVTYVTFQVNNYKTYDYKMYEHFKC